MIGWAFIVTGMDTIGALGFTDVTLAGASIPPAGYWPATPQDGCEQINGATVRVHGNPGERRAWEIIFVDERRAWLGSDGAPHFAPEVLTEPGLERIIQAVYHSAYQRMTRG
jgi:hypothetical protein